MRLLPRDPREAAPGNRTFWLVIFLIEWGIRLSILYTAAGFVALFLGYPGGDIALVIGAGLGVLTVLGGWALQIYQKKSISRGKDQPDGREENK